MRRYILNQPHHCRDVKPEDLLEFLSYARRLKQTPRTGWVESGIHEPESVADHSYRVALAAMALSDSLGLDTCRVIRMALLHDLAEAITGDVPPMRKKKDHKGLEDQAMRQIVSALPDPIKDLYWEAWREYQRKEIAEAVLVHDADKIEMMLQASEYQEAYPATDLSRFYHVTASPSIQKIVEKIKERKG